jgi:hypothetical protein
VDAESDLLRRACVALVNEYSAAIADLRRVVRSRCHDSRGCMLLDRGVVGVQYDTMLVAVAGMQRAAVMAVARALASLAAAALPPDRSERASLMSMSPSEDETGPEGGSSGPGGTSADVVQRLDVLRRLAERTEVSPSSLLWDDDLVVAGYYAVRAAHFGERTDLAAAASRLLSSIAELADGEDAQVAGPRLAATAEFEVEFRRLVCSEAPFGGTAEEVGAWVARHVDMWSLEAGTSEGHRT